MELILILGVAIVWLLVVAWAFGRRDYPNFPT